MIATSKGIFALMQECLFEIAEWVKSETSPHPLPHNPDHCRDPLIVGVILFHILIAVAGDRAAFGVVLQIEDMLRILRSSRHTGSQ